MSKGPLNPDINPFYANPDSIPEQYWERLRKVYVENKINFVFLSTNATLDIEKRNINFEFEVKHTYQLYLVILHYLYQKKISFIPSKLIWVLPNELKGGVHFFKDSHPINTGYVINFFKNRTIIENVMKKFGGISVAIGDLGFIVPVFEDVLLRYIFWEGDEEFGDNLTINVQKNLEDFFPLDVIWAMINVVNQLITSFSKNLTK